jgi:hypothetical protein
MFNRFAESTRISYRVPRTGILRSSQRLPTGRQQRRVHGPEALIRKTQSGEPEDHLLKESAFSRQEDSAIVAGCFGHRRERGCA